MAILAVVVVILIPAARSLTPLRHLHRCHELEAAAERAVAEQQACHAQLESLQKTLVDQQALLANKVGGAYLTCETTYEGWFYLCGKMITISTF